VAVCSQQQSFSGHSKSWVVTVDPISDFPPNSFSQRVAFFVAGGVFIFIIPLALFSLGIVLFGVFGRVGLTLELWLGK
jgi:hypothetical protein